MHVLSPEKGMLQRLKLQMIAWLKGLLFRQREKASFSMKKEQALESDFGEDLQDSLV